MKLGRWGQDGRENHFCFELMRPEIRPCDFLLVFEVGLTALEDLTFDRQVLELVENPLESAGGEMRGRVRLSKRMGWEKQKQRRNSVVAWVGRAKNGACQ